MARRPRRPASRRNARFSSRPPSADTCVIGGRADIPARSASEGDFNPRWRFGLVFFSPREPVLTINDIPLEDTFAEAFPMTAARLLVTAETPAWARTAGLTATGYAASVIGCDAEAGIERELSGEETPDGRPGVSLLFFAFSRDALQKALINRTGQCILTCPTTACYNGLPIDRARALRVGGQLRFFGDGFQFSKLLDGRRFWRLPVMDGEFVCE